MSAVAPEGTTPAIAGDLGAFPVADLLQILETARKSGVLEIDGCQQRARIEFRRGEVSSARFGSLLGEEALLALLGLKEGHFEFWRISVFEQESLSPIGTTVRALMLRAAVREDEECRNALSSTASETVRETRATQTAEPPIGRQSGSGDRAAGKAASQLAGVQVTAEPTGRRLAPLVIAGASIASVVAVLASGVLREPGGQATSPAQTVAMAAAPTEPSSDTRDDQGLLPDVSPSADSPVETPAPVPASPAAVSGSEKVVVRPVVEPSRETTQKPRSEFGVSTRAPEPRAEPRSATPFDAEAPSAGERPPEKRSVPVPSKMADPLSRSNQPLGQMPNASQQAGDRDSLQLNLPEVWVGDFIPSGPGIEPPHLVKKLRVRLTAEGARRLGSRDIRVRVLVDHQGKAVEAELAGDLPLPSRDAQKVLLTAKKAQFTPASKDGVPVKTWTEIVIGVS